LTANSGSDEQSPGSERWALSLRPLRGLDSQPYIVDAVVATRTVSMICLKGTASVCWQNIA